MTKRLIALILICALLCGCTAPAVSTTQTEPSVPVTTQTPTVPETEPTVPETVPTVTEPLIIENYGDPLVLTQLEETIYSSLILELDSSDSFVEKVEVAYVSAEYLQELEFNSKSNIYFGYSLEELNAQFVGTRYVFTLGEDGRTIVQPFQEYEDPYGPVMDNLRTGGGFLLVCVTIASVASGNPVSITSVISLAVEHGTPLVVSAITAFATSVYRSYTTGALQEDSDSALKNAAIAGSEKFKFAAFSGMVSEATGIAASFLRACTNGLSQMQAARVQQESHLPPEFINSFHSEEEYNVYRNAGLSAQKVNGQWAFVRNIDWSYTDSQGRTNAQRVQEGLSPLDPTGQAYELHHIGQLTDSPLAILTSQEHKGNFSILHANTGQTQGQQPSQGSDWTQQRRDFWLALLEISGFTH